jgi:NADH dehydrogenase
MRERTPTRIVIVGGGFGGVYTALELQRLLRRDGDVEVTIVSRDNFLLFTPMLHEVAASDLDVTHIVNPVRKLLPRVRFFDGDVAAIDLVRRTVVVAHGADAHTHDLAYDHLVVALGSVTNFFGIPGLAERALTMKSLGDAIALRNRMIARLEEADAECSTAARVRLLTFVVAGAGFAGVETAAAMNDFVREAIRFYPRIAPEMVRMVLVHPDEVVLPELSPSLGRYAQRKLEARGVEVRGRTKVTAIADAAVGLSDGTIVPASTVVWTAGTTPSPLVGTLPCTKQRGRLCVNDRLQVEGWPGVWALGDCALVPDGANGRFHPPTAQHAIRQGRCVARNVVAALRGRPARPFAFRTIGQLASLGRRTGVAQILGVNFSGFVAWWLWRTIYLAKLPRFEKKVRVALDWTLDLVFSKDFAKFVTTTDAGASHRERRPAEAPLPSFTSAAPV